MGNKQTKLQTPLGLLSDSVDMWSAVLFFCFFEVLAIWSKPCKNLEKSKKKQNCRPHWGSCLTLWTCGLQVCLFCFFVFSRFWPSGANHAKTWKNSKKRKKQNCRPHWGSCLTLWTCGLQFCFFWFFEVLAIWSKPCKNIEKTKKTKLQTPLGLLSDSVDMWSAVLVVLFFLFFEVLAIWSKPCKNLEKPTKTQKQNCRPHWGPCLTLWTCGLQWSAVFFCLFLFFRGSGPSGANHAKTSKNKKKQNCRPHWGSCLTLWTCGLQFCFFLVFRDYAFTTPAVSTGNVRGNKILKDWLGERLQKSLINIYSRKY